MSGFILKRLGFAVVTLFAVLTIVFFIVRILPGDPALVILGDQASMEAIDALRARLGLNRPLPVQYVDFMAGVLTGDWGVSLVSGRPVIEEIVKVLPATIELTVVSLVLGAITGIPLGVWSAVRRNRLPDYATRLLSLIGLSFPPSFLQFCFSWSLPFNCGGFRSSVRGRGRHSRTGSAISLSRPSILA